MRRIIDCTVLAVQKFQSTHSLRSATCGSSHLRRAWYSFNPRTPCGVRHHHRSYVRAENRFNPRTPCGVRPALADLDMINMWVSIHALLAECDSFREQDKRQDAGFNPRTPCGVRPFMKGRNGLPTLFQSTHSLRSATVQVPEMICEARVSIHALLAECDDILPDNVLPALVSIHALLAECDATDFIHYYSTEQIILCANLPKKTVIARLHFLSIYLSIFYSQCITPIADLPGNSCELEVGAQAMFHSL